MKFKVITINNKIMPKTDLTNKFFNINKLPHKEGLTIFPISISRIDTKGQSPKRYYDFVKNWSKNKLVRTNNNVKAGSIFLYTDYLYLYSNEKAWVLMDSFRKAVARHVNALLKLFRVDTGLILESFSYITFNQLCLLYPKYINYLEDLKKIYVKDKKFQKYLKEDFNSLNHGKKFDNNAINFYLDEHLMSYLITKGEMILDNKFINGKEKWILMCYPGNPPKALIYLHQQNFFNLDNPKNIYQDSYYDMDKNILYDFPKVDLETLEY